jgi:hypothetical protein
MPSLVIGEVCQILVPAESCNNAVLEIGSFERPDAAGPDAMVAQDRHPDSLTEQRQKFANLVLPNLSLCEPHIASLLVDVELG